MIFPNALITGATGFVGAHLVQRLLAEGWGVHVIIRPGSSCALLQPVMDRITLHIHAGDADGLIKIVAASRPHTVFHLASLFLAQHTSSDVAPLIQSNVLFPTQLLEAMAVNGVSRLINTGTSWQHYENEEYNPVCLYAATKQAFEAMLEYYLRVANFSAITLKLFDTYGPNDPRKKLFALLKQTAITREPLLMSPGEQLIDLVYIDDVIEAYLGAAERLANAQPGSKESFAVTSGSPLKLRTLVEIYQEEIGIKLPIEWGRRSYRQREVMVPWPNGITLPGWAPRVSLREGVRLLRAASQQVSSE